MTARESVVAETATKDVITCGQCVVPTETSVKSVVAVTAAVDVFSSECIVFSYAKELV